mgnify:CR=1 FL=1
MSPEIPISPPIRTACLRASVPDRISITSSSLPRRTGSQALAAASMVMAICSFLFMLNMGSLFFGSLGVIFALLSRGAGRMSGTAKAGLAGCTIGIIVGICMYASFLLFNMVSGGSTNLLERYYNQYMQEYQMTPDNGTTTDGNTI